jgi:hypothetical protein
VKRGARPPLKRKTFAKTARGWAQERGLDGSWQQGELALNSAPREADDSSVDKIRCLRSSGRRSPAGLGVTKGSLVGVHLHLLSFVLASSWKQMLAGGLTEQRSVHYVVPHVSP